MTSPAPLTEAEQLAYVEIFGGAHNTDHSMLGLKPGATCKRCESTARAVVAAVRPLIAAEALRSARKSITEHKERLRADRTRLGQRFEGRCSGLEEAAGKLTTAIKSLSLPASKETPDGR